MNTPRLGWTLIHFLWEGMLIATIYAAIRRSLTGSNGRYLLACAALFAMTVAPIGTWLAIGQSDAPLAVAMDQTAKVSGKVVTLPVAVESGVPVAPATPWLQWAVMIWIAGASMLSVRLLGGWIMAARLRWTATRPAPLEWVHTMELLGSQLRIPRAVGLRVSAMVQSPVVIGALRPLVLVPVGMLAGLPAAQVEALLIHELTHIRRHDYLVNLLQSISEALLFYHPAVWWVSGHIRTEREHCCDDAAVAVSGDLTGYVNALAELAGNRSMALAAVAATGGSLTDRIARLLGETRPAPPRKHGTLLAAVLLAAAAYGVYAQDAPRPSFQAASVKLNSENPQRHVIRPQPGGRLTTENAQLLTLIQVAYGVQAYQVIGGPVWLNTDGYDVEAKPENQANQAQMLEMLQTLLADRFKLALHRETRELPVYELAAAKGGFNPPAGKGACFQINDPSPPQGGLPCGFIRTGMSGSMDGVSVPISGLVKTLAAIAGRPVIDKTGFAGTLDIHLSFTPDQATRGLPGGALAAPPPEPDPSRPNIFDALQEQMGLKLISSKGPVEVLVIDHVEKPSAN